MKNLHKFKTGRVFVLSLLCLFAASQQLTAQINPLKAIYFENQYLANPAMAGLSSGLRVNLHYRQQWTSIPDAPVTQGITSDFRLGGNTGIGLNLLQDRSGLLTRTKAMATYAYHIPLSGEDQSLNFGLSAGVMSDKIDMGRLIGDGGDMSLAQFNDKGPYFETELGMAYIGKGLTVQASFPSIRAFVDKKLNESNTINRSSFFAAASYKVGLGATASLEPKIVYRGIKGFDDLLDVGANITLADNAFNIMGMYHSSKNVTVGAGAKLLDRFRVAGMYTSSGSAINSETINTNAVSTFELGLQVLLKKRGE